MRSTLALASLFTAASIGLGAAAQQQQQPDRAKASEKVAQTQGGGTTIPGNADTVFVEAAARGNVAEVELGRLAQERGDSSQIKALGARLVADHTKANDELKAIAARQQITVPTAPDARHNALKSKLEALNGAAFDRAFVDAMIADHKTTIASFQQEGSSGSDAALKSHASKTVPALKQHLEMADAAKAALSKAGR